MFLDVATIYLKPGNGGEEAVLFHQGTNVTDGGAAEGGGGGGV